MLVLALFIVTYVYSKCKPWKMPYNWTILATIVTLFTWWSHTIWVLPPNGSAPYMLTQVYWDVGRPHTAFPCHWTPYRYDQRTPPLIYKGCRIFLLSAVSSIHLGSKDRTLMVDKVRLYLTVQTIRYSMWESSAYISYLLWGQNSPPSCPLQNT